MRKPQMQIRQHHAAFAACMVVMATVGLSGCASAHGNRASTSTSAVITAKTASASAATATATTVPVEPCARQSSGNAMSGAAQPSTTVSDLRGVQFDRSEMGFYGVPLMGAAQTVLGQAGANCSYVVGGNGSTYITVTGSRASLYETYLPGGIEIIAEDLCGAFPQAADTVNAQMANAGAAATCTADTSSSVHELSTGLPISGLYVGIREIPAGSEGYIAQQLPASSHETTWQLDLGNTHVVMTGGGTSLDFKSLACAAAPADEKLCTASFEYFISGLITQAGYGRPDLSTLYKAIAAHLS